MLSEKQDFLLYWKRRRRELLNALNHYIQDKGLSFGIMAGTLFKDDKHKIVDLIEDKTIELYLTFLKNIDKRIGELGHPTLEQSEFFRNFNINYYNFLKNTFEF